MRKYTEFGLIDRIRGMFPPGDAEAGIGDDAAVIENGRRGRMLVTTDSLVEGVHFLPGTVNYDDLGYKSIAVNMSDIAAMGGVPAYALITLGIPDRMTDTELEALLLGIKSAGEEQPYSLVGGDTVRSPFLFISVTMIGHTSSYPFLRRGAKAGELIYVTGTLGDSSIGLGILKKDLRFAVADSQYFVRRHNRPAIRVGLMQSLRNEYSISSAIDISDGLLSDLSHLADESGVGFSVDADRLPVSAGHIGQEFGRNMKYFLELAWGGGEDYEILFTSKDDINFAGVTRIGEVTGSGREIFLSGERLPWDELRKGFEHF